MFSERQQLAAYEDKASIDEYLSIIKSGRLSYVLKSDAIYFKLIRLLYDSNKPLMYTVCRHRFYVEYKAKVI